METLQLDRITAINGDCMEYMKSLPDKCFDLAIVDPPYGIGEDGRKGVRTWCYDCKYYYKIFVCQYRQKAWKNHYHIESMLAGLNGCDGYAVNSTIEEFAEWVEVSK